MNIETIKKILDEVSVPIQLGGGIRSIEYAKELLDLDIDRLIIGTMGIKNPQTITELSDEYGSQRIMISLDSKDNKVVIKGWQESYWRKGQRACRQCRMPHSPDYHDSHRNIYYFYCWPAQTHA